MVETSAMYGVTPRLVVDVGIIGQASPRWRGANTDADRIENNQRLSESRATAVKSIVEQTLKKALASMNLTFQYDVSYSDDSSIPDKTVVVGTSGRGQSDAIVAAHGDKRNNDPQFRRVDVRIRIAQQLQEYVPRRVISTYKQSTKTTIWYVSVAAGVTIAAVASGCVFFVKLRNQYGQTASGQAIVGGAGVGYTAVPGFDKGMKASASFGDETRFFTSYPVGFEAFDGVGVRYTSAAAGVYVGYEFDYLTFYGLGPGAASLSVGGINLGALLGVSATTGNGVLWLGSLPPNYEIRTYSRTDFDRYKSLWVSEHKISLFFLSGSFELSVDDRANLGNMLQMTAKDVVGG
jgi:hypothetical protein